MSSKRQLRLVVHICNIQDRQWRLGLFPVSSVDAREHHIGPFSIIFQTMKNSSNHVATSILLVIWHFFFYSFPGDICRVCRCEGASDRPLFHPCICTGSIKFIHQDCLLQWLKYSKKEFCELCSHRFSFTPIYSPDMPKRLPLSIIFRYVFILLRFDKKFPSFWSV